MFFRSHFRSMEKADIMWKRNEGRQIGEEPAAAKPRPTCSISRNLLNVRQASSLDSDASNIPGNLQLDSNSVQKSTGVCRAEIKTQQRILKSGINPCPGSTWKHEQSDVCERFRSSWKQVQGTENHLERIWLHFHNMQISDYLHVDKVSGLMYLMRKLMY